MHELVVLSPHVTHVQLGERMQLLWKSLGDKVVLVIAL